MNEELLRAKETFDDPLRKRIMLQFGRYKKLSAETLLEKLKTEDPNQVTAQLNVLETTVFDGEPLLTKQQDNQYHLTQKGHDILIRYITHPERFSKPKAKPKYFNLYWATLFITTIIVVSTSAYITNQPIEKIALAMAFAMGLLGFGYYTRIRPPSVRMNRIMYIMIGVPLGFVIWIGFWMLIMRQVYPQGAGNWVIVVLSIIGCYAVGFVIGDLIGKARNYKGPQQYDW